MSDATLAMKAARLLSRYLTPRQYQPGPNNNVLYITAENGDKCTIIVLAGHVKETPRDAT